MISCINTNGKKKKICLFRLNTIWNKDIYVKDVRQKTIIKIIINNVFTGGTCYCLFYVTSHNYKINKKSSLTKLKSFINTTVNVNSNN